MRREQFVRSRLTFWCAQAFLSSTGLLRWRTFMCLLGALIYALPAAGQSDREAPETSGEARRRIQQLLIGELLNQRRAWQDLEFRIHGSLTFRVYDPLKPRAALAHCHDLSVQSLTVASSRTPGDPRLASNLISRPIPTFIGSRAPGGRGVGFCPGFESPSDSRNSVVQAHDRNPPTPAMLLPFSSALVRELSNAATSFPEHTWFTNQLVRVLTENGQHSEAEQAVARCVGAPTWCRLLQFYVRRGAGTHRDLGLPLETLPVSELAQLGASWLSVQALLDSAEAEHYARLPWAEQRHVDSVFWWLATPFLSETQHLRQAEHYARLIRNQLNVGLPIEAQHDLRVERGADALLLARVRYGFPKHQVWMGRKEDDEHFRFLGRRFNPPYSSMEYDRDNAAVAPSLDLTLDPLGMHDRSVLLSAPRDAIIDRWWPPEFFLHPRGRIVSVNASQRVLLRRDSSALLTVATTVGGGELDSVGGQAVRVVLAHSAGPEAVTRVVSSQAQKGERVVLRQVIRQPGLVGLEILVYSGGLAGARSRWGLREVPTLASLGPTSCAISDPVLVHARESAESFGGMLGSTELVNPTSVGVAWESYGFSTRDSVTISLRIASTDALSGLRRAGMALRVADDPRVNVTMQWRESTPSRTGVEVAGSRPIVYHSVAVDVRKLRAGAYGVEIEMSSATCGTVMATRTLTLSRQE